jgi:hypothetical protein
MTAAVRSLVGMRVSLTYPNCLMKFWIFVVVCAAYTDRSRRSLATGRVALTLYCVRPKRETLSRNAFKDRPSRRILLI